MKTSIFSNALISMKYIVIFLVASLFSLNVQAKEVAKLKSTKDKELIMKTEPNSNERIIEYNGHKLEVYDWENSHWVKSPLSKNTSMLYTVDFICMDEDLNKYNVRIYKKDNKIVKVVVFGEDSTIL